MTGLELTLGGLLLLVLVVAVAFGYALGSRHGWARGYAHGCLVNHQPARERAAKFRPRHRVSATLLMPRVHSTHDTDAGSTS